MSYDNYKTGGASPDWDPVEDERDAPEAETMLTLVHKDADKEGQEVKDGDTLVDFRGKEWRFVRVTRDEKVQVIEPDSESTRLFYPSVFNCVLGEA